MICYNLTMLHPTPIDITNIPELVRIAEEVEATKTPRELKRQNKTVAVIMPAGAAGQHKSRLHKRSIWTHYDPKRVRAALQASAGALQGIDRAELFSDLASQRSQESSGRPF
jgi:hypothetical protein